MILFLHPLLAEAKKPKPAPKPNVQLTGTVAGAPFEVVRALGTGDPNHPGVLAITLTDRPLPCKEVPPPDATLLVFGFEPTAGTSSIGPAMALSQERRLFSFLQAKATLLTLPSVAGETGKVRLDSVSGEGTSLSGEVTFELCEVVAPAQPPTSTFGEAVVDVGEGEDATKVKAKVPTDWTAGRDPLGDPSWRAQDGVTTYTLSATCGGTCDPARWADNAERWQSDQTSAFVGQPGYEIALGKNELVAEGTRVVRYTMTANGMPTAVAAVLRYDPSWPQMLICQIRTPAKNTEILDQAEQACLATAPAGP